MNSLQLYNSVSYQCSQKITEEYSTSFSSAIRLLHPDLRAPIHAIYGFVRLADEIVDTFHQYDKTSLLSSFRKETFDAIHQGISLNPVLNSFQHTVIKYNIDPQLIEAFFHSMEIDLEKNIYKNKTELDEYIYGSAEVVGLMCLYVFCEGNRYKYNQLKPAARSLGAAFQKVNFLRDLNADSTELNRNYFPGFNINHFDKTAKEQIEQDIEKDFYNAFEGIRKLPSKAKFGVYVAYKYYWSLFKKIKKMRPEIILEQRVRIPNYRKMMIILRAGFANQMNLM
jgi:15-cis-phytoene synthase